jgi:branched-chain amino acid transport system substrate-binding protein
MRVDLHMPLGAVAAVVCAALAVTGCENERMPVRIGVLAECSGVTEDLHEPMLAGAELPFLQRGARRRGRNPTDGLTGGSAGGRPVELIEACTEIGDLSLMISETRDLIETEGADVIIGPVGETEGMVMRRIAARHPDTTFLLGASAAQAATLREPLPNMFRFVADGAQQAAGLATYARRDLGWRHAAVVFDDFPNSWESAAGFVAEFCALGGSVVARGAFTGSAMPDRALGARLAHEVDGVALIALFDSPADFLRAYARRAAPLPRRLVLNGYGFSLPGGLAPRGVDLSGVILGLDIPLASERPQWRAYVRAYQSAFPEIAPSFGVSPGVLPVYLSAEATARALERTGGEVGKSQHRLRAALRAVAFEGPAGPVRLDRNRQAIVSVHLRRIADPQALRPTQPVRVVHDVEQSFAGAFNGHTPLPSRESPRC